MKIYYIFPLLLYHNIEVQAVLLIAALECIIALNYLARSIDLCEHSNIETFKHN